MKTIEPNWTEDKNIPVELLQNIWNWDHLKIIWWVENNFVNRIQMNLRLKLIELLRSNKSLSPTEFFERKMEVLAMVPPDLCEVPSIQNILKEIRYVNSVNIEPKSRLEIVRDFLKKYL